MMERPPNSIDSNNERIELGEEFLRLGNELSENKEGFPFPGVNHEFYLERKASEERLPGYATPIDDLIERFKNEGMKVVLSETPGNREVFILPSQSDNIVEDSISPKNLQTEETLSNEIKKLISLSKSLK